MRKRKTGILITFILLFALVGCASLWQNKPGVDGLIPGLKAYNSSEVYKRNISSGDLNINRVKVEYTLDGDSRSFTGFLKRKRSGRMVFSARSVAGLEVLRLFADADSIKAYDKINKVLYIQSRSYLEKKIGLDYALIPLLWGDLPSEFRDVECTDTDKNYFSAFAINGTYRYELSFLKQSGKLYKVDCYRSESKIFDIYYGDYESAGGLIYPSSINYHFYEREIDIKVGIKGVSDENIKSIRFNVGNDVSREILR